MSVSLAQNGVPIYWKSIAKDGADLPPEQAVVSPATFLIAPGETYDFEVRPEQQGDLELTVDLALFKEKLVQPIRLESR